MDKTQTTVSQVTGEAARSIHEIRRTMRQAAHNVKEAAANSLLSAAENIRLEAVKSGNSEAIQQAHQLARGMEKAAVYLDSHTLDQMGDDVAQSVSQNPWQWLAIVFVVGMLLGRMLGGGRRS